MKAEPDFLYEVRAGFHRVIRPLPSPASQEACTWTATLSPSGSVTPAMLILPRVRTRGAIAGGLQAPPYSIDSCDIFTWPGGRLYCTRRNALSEKRFQPSLSDSLAARRPNVIVDHLPFAASCTAAFTSNSASLAAQPV